MTTEVRREGGKRSGEGQMRRDLHVVCSWYTWYMHVGRRCVSGMCDAQPRGKHAATTQPHASLGITVRYTGHQEVGAHTFSNTFQLLACLLQLPLRERDALEQKRTLLALEDP